MRNTSKAMILAAIAAMALAGCSSSSDISSSEVAAAEKSESSEFKTEASAEKIETPVEDDDVESTADLTPEDMEQKWINDLKDRGYDVHTFVKDGDNSAVTDDGMISESFEYNIDDDGNFHLDVTVTNNSDEPIYLDCRPHAFLRTDLTPDEKEWGWTSDFQGDIIGAGESIVKSIVTEPEEGWSTAKAEIYLTASISIGDKYDIGIYYVPSGIEFELSLAR
ncbi:MAG: hypothetical protein IJ571_03740 [Ruminococcus sp.]|nr:hypothetical protein [Ruminococcus sp.]